MSYEGTGVFTKENLDTMLKGVLELVYKCGQEKLNHLYSSERAKETFNMAKNQKSYIPEFKQQMVDLYHAGGTLYPQLERE